MLEHRYMAGTNRNVKGEIVLKSSSEVEWKIPDFFLLPEAVDYSFVSPSFPYLDGTWCLRCQPNGSVHGITIALKRIYSTSHHNITLRLGIKDKEGLKYISRIRNSDFEKDGFGWGVFLHMSRAYMEEYKTRFSDRDEISFFCMLSSGFSKGAVSRTIRSKVKDVATETSDGDFNISQKRFEDDNGAVQELTGTDKLSECFEKLFLSGDQHDIIIKVQDQEIRAHEIIISARCPVFASMFRHDTIEKNTGVITIEDADPEAFREFLSFLYSGKLENLSAENVIELYVIADKYQVNELKSQCLQFMLRNMSDETFCDFISLALRHNERDLLNFATDYFVKNVKTIIVTVKWQSFHKEYPVESNELYIKAITHLIPD